MKHRSPRNDSRASGRSLAVSLLAHTIVVALSLAVFGYAWASRRGPRAMGPRTSQGATQLPASAPGSRTPFGVEDAFPGLEFFEPLDIVQLPGDAPRYLVLERRGTVQLVDAAATPATKKLFLDISAQVWRTPLVEDGAMSITLHPQFGVAGSPSRGYVYLFYCGRDEDDGRYNRLSRFNVPDGADAADRGSELILIDIVDRHRWHNGGCTRFGPDGFLYISFGDEGDRKDSFQNSQHIDRSFFSGLLRIDVDSRGAPVSHPPPRQPRNGRTQGYFIPDDNPFVGRPGVLEEFWALGFRNPHRMSFDPADGTLWLGDVGEVTREEVNIVERGSNCMWSYGEGTISDPYSPFRGKKPEPYFGIETPPLLEYPHASLNNSVIGGHVYRGSAYPELTGKYVYGDNGSGRIWALQRDDKKGVTQQEIAVVPQKSMSGLSSIAVDRAGELLFTVLGTQGEENGTIRRLVRAPANVESNVPRLLSQTGIFTDVRRLEAADFAQPYALNAPSWSGGSRTRHWIILPGSGNDPDPEVDSVIFSASGPWKFPPGSAFVQHHDVPAGDGGALRRIETRVLVLQADGGAYGLSYRWRDDQSDAELLETAQSVELVSKTAEGVERRIPWQFPSRQECVLCHTANAGYVLGVNARQLNRDFEYPGIGFVSASANQLREWSRTGMFDRTLQEKDIAEARPLSRIDDASVPVADRVRSYLDVNCSHCHRPGAVLANFDARIATPLAEQRILSGLLNTQLDGLGECRVVEPGDLDRSMMVQRLLLSGERRMPQLAPPAYDWAAIDLIGRWIAGASGGTDADWLGASVPEVERLRAGSADPAAIDALFATTRGRAALVRALESGALPDAVRDAVLERAADPARGHLVEYFRRFQPGEQGKVKLGMEFDPQTVLALSGDSARGERLFRSGSSRCRDCHRAGDAGADFGPDLGKIGGKYGRKEILENILEPSKVVEEKFAGHTLVTASGAVLSGIVVERTDSAVTLKESAVKTTTVPSAEIIDSSQAAESLMPQFLLSELSAQEAADLIDYLAGLR